MSKSREILQWTTERIPEEATHWSLRLMAKHAGVTRWQVPIPIALLLRDSGPAEAIPPE